MCSKLCSISPTISPQNILICIYLPSSSILSIPPIRPFYLRFQVLSFRIIRCSLSPRSNPTPYTTQVFFCPTHFITPR